MMGWYNDGWGAGSWAAMSLMMLFWIAVLSVAVWAGVHFLRGGGSHATASPTPRALLDARLASGEIDAEQYANLRRLLEGQSAAQ
jgi:putative membrane protein